MYDLNLNSVFRDDRLEVCQELKLISVTFQDALVTYREICPLQTFKAPKRKTHTTEIEMT